MRGACLQHRSANHKLGKVVEVPSTSPTSGRKFPTRYKALPPYVATTYASIRGTCPSSCVLKDAGCYAQGGFTNMVVSRLDKEAEGLDDVDVALAEADLITNAWKKVPQDGYRSRGRDLRLHVSGDCRSTLGAKMLAEGVAEFQRRGGGRAWTFTHSWREIARKAWGAISTLASVETAADARKARGRGYAPALVVNRFPRRDNYFTIDGERFIPCPAQTRNATCVECRLCLYADKLHRGKVGIAFEVHGTQDNEARAALVQLRLPHIARSGV